MDKSLFRSVGYLSVFDPTRSEAVNKMATISCKHGVPHTHNSVEESRACWAGPPRAALGMVTSTGPGPSVLPGRGDWHNKPVSEKQLWKIEQLGGKNCARAAKYLTRGNASALIDELLHPEKEARPVTPDPTPAPAAPAPIARPVDPRHAMIAGLLDMVPDGYYAVHEYEGGHVDFLRISRPKKNKYAGGIKIQTVMGSWMSVRLKAEPDAVLWPSGTLSVYDRSGRTEDKLLLLVADPQGALRRYAKLIGNCCRCNASLTDDRSRHYGIGPECEKKPGWTHIIETVDMEDAIAAAEAAL